MGLACSKDHCRRRQHVNMNMNFKQRNMMGTPVEIDELESPTAEDLQSCRSSIVTPRRPYIVSSPVLINSSTTPVQQVRFKFDTPLIAHEASDKKSVASSMQDDGEDEGQDCTSAKSSTSPNPDMLLPKKASLFRYDTPREWMDDDVDEMTNDMHEQLEALKHLERQQSHPERQPVLSPGITATEQKRSTLNLLQHGHSARWDDGRIDETEEQMVKHLEHLIKATRTSIDSGLVQQGLVP